MRRRLPRARSAPRTPPPPARARPSRPSNPCSRSIVPYWPAFAPTSSTTSTSSSSRSRAAVSERSGVYWRTSYPILPGQLADAVTHGQRSKDRSRSPRGGRPRSARARPPSAPPRAGQSSARARSTRRSSPARRRLRPPHGLGERRQRGGDDGQAGGEVLVHLHREDRARSASLIAYGMSAGVGAAQHGGQLGVGARRRAGGRSGARSSAETSVPGSPAPTGPTSANAQSGRRARQPLDQVEVELGRDDRAGEDDPRLAAARPSPGPPGRPASAVGEQRGVGDVRARRATRSESVRMRSASARRGGQHEVGAAREARLGRAERGRRRRPSARRCRRRSGRRRATGRAPRAAPRPAARSPQHGAARSPRRRTARRRPARAAAARSARARPRRPCSGTTSGDSTCSPSAAARGRAAPRRRRRAIRRSVAAGQLRPAQPERLDEQHAVARGEPRHQVVLVGPQLRVPVGEADAHDLAAGERSCPECSRRRRGGSVRSRRAPRRPGRCPATARPSGPRDPAGSRRGSRFAFGPAQHEALVRRELLLGVERAGDGERAHAGHGGTTGRRADRRRGSRARHRHRARRACNSQRAARGGRLGPVGERGEPHRRRLSHLAEVRVARLGRRAATQVAQPHDARRKTRRGRSSPGRASRRASRRPRPAGEELRERAHAHADERAPVRACAAARTRAARRRPSRIASGRESASTCCRSPSKPPDRPVRPQALVDDARRVVAVDAAAEQA